MHYNAIISLLGISSVVSGLAVPASPPTDTTNTTTVLDSRGLATSADCQFFNSRGNLFWVSFFGVSADQPDYANCELGFLDNLRGQCAGEVIDWGCSNNGGVLYTMGHVPLGGPKCVQDAIYLSQGGLSGVTCAIN